MNINTKWMCIRKNNIKIYASSLAIFCNMNKYEDRNEIIKKIKAIVQNDNTFKTKEEKAIEKVESTDDKKLKNIMKIECANISEVKENIKQVKECTDDIDVIRVFEKKFYTELGIKEEDNVREKTNTIMNKKYEKTDTFVTSKRPIITVGKYRIFVGGRHDGMDDDGNLIEIKNRINELLGVTLYDKVQIHAYMYIFEKRNATLIENYGSIMERHEIDFDDDFWKEIKAELKVFVSLLFDLLD